MITVQTQVNAPLETVWEYWTNPKHVLHWNHASADWHTTKATNQLELHGTFCYTMAAKDGSFSFDFGGQYTLINPQKNLHFTLADHRTVQIAFENTPNGVIITETFEPENQNSHELQQAGWQAILDNFKNYTEQTQN
ncbi:SRPBCC domain-containing protein [Flavobacterium branchiophilum]|uniref:Polyketide cyclase n=1 Tax=Flavobacterium branchiophilum TaxID=55197 RepID=A0A2H3KNK5_9FLAO|nr:SRPBCC domain-containing protein [Flavobacterium branchiophilum]PDS25233.1 polyketide cyclase [Flavobacterium branchiophilum]